MEQPINSTFNDSVQSKAFQLIETEAIKGDPESQYRMGQILLDEALQESEKKGSKSGDLDETQIQNAKKGLEFADIGYVLVSGQTAIAGKGRELLNNPDVGRLFLGG